MSEPSRPGSRPIPRRTRSATGSGSRPTPRPPFLILSGSEEIQVESLGSMALRLSHPGPKDGWRIIDDGGREWSASELQAAVLDPEGRRPSDPQRSRIADDGLDDAPRSGPGRHATMIGVGMVVAGLALLATCRGGTTSPPPASVQPPVPAEQAPATPPPAPVPAPPRPPPVAVSEADLANGLIAQYAFASAETIGRNGTSQAGADALAVVGVAVERDPRLAANVAVFAGDSHLQLPVVVRGEFTIAWWMRTTQVEPMPAIPNGSTAVGWFQGVGLVSGETPADVADFGCMLIAGRIAFGAGGPDTTLLSQAQVGDGAWHHVAVTRDGGNGDLALVIDGRPDGRCPGPRGPRSATAALWVGTNGPGVGAYAGRLADLRFYGRVLQPAELALLAHPARPLR
jgi:hypothetical protein